MKILITGGHITPALAVIEELERQKTGKIVFIGRKYALDFEKTPSFEYQVIKKRGIKFINLRAGRLSRILSLKSLLNLLKFPLGLTGAFRVLKKEAPDLVLSFGGYVALPIGLAAYGLKIPVFTHEQTIIPGLTNRLIGRFAKKVFVSFPASKKYFKQEKVELTGNPLRRAIFKVKKKPFVISQNQPTIYVTGGSLGSHSLNLQIEKILPQLLSKFQVIHQVGDTEQYQDFERLSNINHKNYFIKKHFYDDEIGYIYSISDLVVSRAGANTIFELIALKKPSILIPLPWSAAGEQLTQAQLLKDQAVADVFNQDDESELLLSKIAKVVKEIRQYKKNFAPLEHLYKKDAAKNIVSQILAQA